ncbi:MAG: hypothetical protein IJA48_04505 [Oscillospiraceae bacterium]|nr:hypothetical protein [Oscillospiraceae bacterium]
MKKIVTVVILCLTGILMGGCFTFGYSPKVPQEGIWYCHELQVQMAFSKGIKTYAIIDGIEIECATLNDRGSNYVGVIYQDLNHKDLGYRLGDSLFEGECRKLTDNTLYVEDENGDIYEFVRINP